MTKNLDLFTGKETEIILKKKGYLEVKRLRKYREAEDKSVSCKTCDHCVYKQMSRRYYKCKKLSLSASAASDIRLKCVCILWKLNEEDGR